MKPTDEQLSVLKGFEDHSHIRVIAVAGAGKTSTLGLLAKRNPHLSLYITFNKNMAEEARNKFPSHVEVRTSHSIAFQSKGVDISHKLSRPVGRYQNVCGTGSEIAKYFKIPPFGVGVDEYVSTTSMGYSVKDTVDNFQYSADTEMSKKHVSMAYVKKFRKNPLFDVDKFKKEVLNVAKSLWLLRKDPNSKILATHDTYMKLWQLSNPDLSEHYEIIYLDEAHDTNPCLMDIILKQKCRVVMVGDPYQQIYAFRKAVDALQHTDWPKFELTTSFRYGESISSVAQQILSENGSILQKVSSHDSTYSEVHSVPKQDRYVKVFRTNAALISEAMIGIVEGKRINLNIDLTDFKNMVTSVSALKNNDMKMVKHAEVIMYEDWLEFAKDMNEMKSGELYRVYCLVKEGNADRIIRILSEYRPFDNPDFVYTTAHKAKGLEFDYVVLADDFPFLSECEPEEYPHERNLLYVALTRAKKYVVLNDQCKEVIHEWNLSCKQKGE